MTTKKKGARNQKLRRSRHVSFFQKHDELFLYHDLWGYVLGFDRVVYELIMAFGEGEPLSAVKRAFQDRLPAAQLDGFLDTLERHRVIVPREFDERAETHRLGYPIRAPWTLVYTGVDGSVTVAYKGRTTGKPELLELDPLARRLFLACDGEKTIEELAEEVESDLPRREVKRKAHELFAKLTHSGVQVLKLLERPRSMYLHVLPPYAKSVMPYAPLTDAAPAVRDVVDLSGYHRDVIGNAAEQFDVEETTLSHMLRDPHPALGGKSYGEALLGALVERSLWPAGGRVLELGGGVGFFSRRLLESVERGAAPAPASYAVLDLSPVLQASQRMMHEGLARRPRYLLANASRPLPLAAGSLDLFISNEVIADLVTVRLRKDELERADGPPEVLAARALVKRTALPLVEDAPEVFWLNLGALRLVEELARVLKPGGAAVLTEFGSFDAYPEESTHLDHGEFSIHFGHVAHVARAAGLSVELTDILELLRFDGDVRTIVTTRASFEALRALCASRGVEVQKLAYTEPMLREALRGQLSLDGLEGISFQPIRERVHGLHPKEFKVAILRKPAASGA